MTAIEELLAEEEKGAAQAAAKKAKKQRQKAKKQQQQPQASLHQPQQQQQPQASLHQPQQQQQSSELGRQLGQAPEHVEAQHPQQKQITDDTSSHLALAELHLSDLPSMADGVDPGSRLAIPGEADMAAGSSCGPQPLPRPDAAVPEAGESRDLFLQDLFCCPLTKVSSCAVSTTWTDFSLNIPSLPGLRC